MKKLFLKAFVLCAFLLWASPTVAAEKNSFSSWAEASRFLESEEFSTLPDKEKCHSFWTILWPWAKNGNLQARAYLFFYILPVGSHAEMMVLPGRSEDELSKLRDAVILAIHSTGVDFEDEGVVESYIDFTDMVYKEAFSSNYIGQGFMQCLQEKPRTFCAKAATKSLVPKFDDYAFEIDSMIAQGAKPTCYFNKRSEIYNTEEKRP